MSDDSLNDAMRRQGYVRCQRWWLTPEQFALVEYMARKNFPEVIQIKDEVRRAKDSWEMENFGQNLNDMS